MIRLTSEMECIQATIDFVILGTVERSSLGIDGYLKRDSVIKRRAHAVNYLNEKLSSRFENKV